MRKIGKKGNDLEKYIMEGLLALLPGCRGEVGKSIIFTLEGSYANPSGVPWLVKKLAFYFSVDLPELRRRCGKLLEMKHNISLPLSDRLVLLPVKARQAAQPGETTTGFINLLQVKQILPPLPQTPGRANGGAGPQLGLEAGQQRMGGRPQQGQEAGQQRTGDRLQQGQEAGQQTGARTHPGEFPGDRPQAYEKESGVRSQHGQPAGERSGARSQHGQPAGERSGARPQYGQSTGQKAVAWRDPGQPFGQRPGSRPRSGELPGGGPHAGQPDSGPPPEHLRTQKARSGYYFHAGQLFPGPPHSSSSLHLSTPGKDDPIWLSRVLFKCGLHLKTLNTPETMHERLRQGEIVFKDYFERHKQGTAFNGLNHQALLELLPNCDCVLKNLFIKQLGLKNYQESTKQSDL